MNVKEKWNQALGKRVLALTMVCSLVGSYFTGTALAVPVPEPVPPVSESVEPSEEPSPPTGSVEVSNRLKDPSGTIQNAGDFFYRLTGIGKEGQAVEERGKTDKNGHLVFDSIPVGDDYTLTEEAVGDGEREIPLWWDALHGIITSIVVGEGTVTQVETKNVFKTGSIKVVKSIETAPADRYNIASERQHHYNDSKAGFAYRVSGTSLYGQSIDQYAVTNPLGVAVLEHLPIGSYTVTEISASEVPKTAAYSGDAVQELTQYVRNDPQIVDVRYNNETHAEETTEVRFEGTLKKWSFSGNGSSNRSLSKIDEETDADAVAQGDATLKGAVYGLYDDAQLVATASTDEEGRFDFDGWFVAGDEWYVQEITPSEGYLLDNTRYPVNACAEGMTANQEQFQTETESKSIVTEQVMKQAIRIHKQKVEGTVSEPLSGAKFGIYLEKELLEYAAATDYSSAIRSASGWTAFFRAVRNHEVKKDGVTVNLSDLPTAILYENESDKLSSLVKADAQNEYRVDYITTDKDGYAVSPDLPFGKYVLCETETPDQTLDTAQAMYAIVSEDSRSPQTLNFSFLDFVAGRYVETSKVDRDTGKNVLKPNAQFLLYACDKNGAYSEKDLIRQSYKDGSKTVTIGTEGSPWTTDEKGIITTVEELKAGSYALHEINAPNGFFNPQKDVIFTVGSDLTYDYRPIYDGEEIIGYDEYLQVECSDPETRGKLTFTCTGETVSGYSAPSLKQALSNAFGLTSEKEFTYETSQLAGAVLSVKAAEDITTQDGQGSLWYHKGENIATIVVGKDNSVTYRDKCSVCKAKEQTYETQLLSNGCPFASVGHTEDGAITLTLPLGTYSVTEIHAPYGYLLTKEEKQVSFGWKGQFEEQVKEKINFDHERSRTKSVILTKTDSLDGEQVVGAVFGLYNEDAIVRMDGTVIVEADTLLATAETNENGILEVSKDLPIACNGNSGRYYFKEQQAAKYYKLDETPQSFCLDDLNQFVTHISRSLAMTNELDGIPELSITQKQSVDRNTATSDPIKAEAGDIITYTVEVENQSSASGDAYELTVTDTLPKGLIYVKNSGGTYQDGKVSWDIDSLKIGEKQTFSFKALVPVTVYNVTYTNSGTVTAANIPLLEAPNGSGHRKDPMRSQSVEAKVGSPNLIITKTVDKLTMQQSDVAVKKGDLVYTVTVVNAGDARANNVTVTDRLDERLVFQKTSAPQKGSVYSLYNIAAGETKTFTISARVNTAVTAPATIYNSAAVDCENNPDKPAQSSEIVTKIISPKLSVVKTQALNSGVATQNKLTGKGGDVITYTLTVTNAGDATSDAFGVELEDKIPGGLVYEDGSVTGGGTCHGGKVSWDIGTLKIGESRSVSFRAAIPATAASRNYRNVASGNADNNPTTPSNEVGADIPGSNPKTGDSYDPVLWAEVGVVSMMICIGGAVVLYRKRKQ